MAFFPITYQCNQKCIFCSGGEGFLGGLNDWISARKRVRRDFIQISGGEPLLTDKTEMLAFLLHCAKEGFRIEFQTNGTLINSLAAQELSALVGIINGSGGHFNINFPAHESKLDFKITDLKNGFERREAAVKTLISEGAIVRLTHVICSANYKFLEKFAVYAAKKLKEISWVQFSFVKAIGRAQNSRAIVPKYEQVSPFLIKALKKCRELKLRCEVDHIPLCFMRDFKSLNVDYGKMLSGQSGLFRKEKKKIKICATCPDRKFCAGARADYLAIYGGFNPDPVVIARRRFPPTKQSINKNGNGVIRRLHRLHRLHRF
ncbi:MAG: radical SAM protein [Elusimicrobia bacterium]|nr:radical SAM protein [Elusimicrobiota bacterium]